MANIYGKDDSEYLPGTPFDDSIFGNGGNDRLDGLAGNDWLWGGTGVDTYYGGTGFDLVFFEDGVQGAIVNLQTNTIANDGFGNAEVVFDVEGVHGSRQADHITLGNDGGYTFGRAGNDTLFGGAFDNQFYPGSGTDFIDGGGGLNAVGYLDDTYDGAGPSAVGVTIDLAAGYAIDNWGFKDVLVNVQFASGSYRDDLLYGTDGYNALSGDAGNDLLVGRGGHDWLNGGPGNDTIQGGEGDDNLLGGAGNDLLDGGDGGSDNADFAGSSAGYAGPSKGAFVDLEAGYAIDGWGDKDTLTGIENIGGTPFGDTLNGDSLPNNLAGTQGADLLIGRAGNDYLSGGEGSDTVDGGDDHDNVYGDGGNDLLRGGKGNDHVDGGDGDDLLEGGAGLDRLFGGAGVDTAFYSGKRVDYTVCMANGQTFLIPLRSLEGKDELHDIEKLSFTDGTFAVADLMQPGCPPDTGELTVFGLTWTENPGGTWTAQGDATIGRRDVAWELLSVRGASFSVAGDTLAVNGGTVSSIADGKERPLFEGAFSLSLKDANGQVAATRDLFTLAGLPAEVTTLQLTKADLRLATDLDLPGVLFAGFGLSQEVIAIGANGPGFAIGSTFDLAKYLNAPNTPPMKLLGKIGVKSEQLQIGYNALEDRLFLKGDVSLVDYPAYEKYKGSGTVVKPVLNLDDAEIGYKDGTLYGKGEITSKDFSFGGGWGINDLKFTFDSTADKYSGSGELALPFKVSGLGGRVEFGVQPEFHLTGFFIEPKFISPGLPIFSTGAFLRSLGGGASNLWSATEPVTWKGSIGIDWLKAVLKLRFEGESDFENQVAGKVKGGILVDDLGLFGSAANPLGAVKFEGSGSLDWTRGLASLSLDSIDVVNTFKGSGTLEGNSALELVTLRGTVSFEVPITKVKVQGDLTIRYSGLDEAQRYAAAWTTTGNVVYGLRIDLDDPFSIPKLFGATEVPLYSSWIVDAGMRDLTVFVGWESAATVPVETRVVVYDDPAKTQLRQVIAEADYAASGIAVLAPWSGPFGKVVYVAAPSPGLWDVEVVNPQGLGAITMSATTARAGGSVAVDALAFAGDLVAVDYTAADPAAPASLLFFADSDDDGLDGVLVGSAAEADGAAQWLWDPAGFASGEYWIYITMEDGKSVPVSAYSAQPILVIDRTDAAPPAAIAFSPADGGGGAPLGGNVVVTFSEPIARGSGSLVLRTAAGTVIESFDAGTSSRILVAGKTLSVDPGADLPAGAPLFLDLPPGSVRDLNGNAFAGTSSYDFFSFAAPVMRTGAARADALLAGRGDDVLAGGGGNDLLIGLYGNDALNGGDGRDLAWYLGSRAAYIVSVGSSVTITGPEGIDTLTGVERAIFADGALAFDIDGNAGQAYRLYQAAFARQPDVPGLSFWIGQMDNGAALEVVAAAFIGSAEFTGLYGTNPGNEQFVTLLYQNVLSRLPDAGGLAFWVDKLDAGAMTRSEVLIGFSESVENKANTLPAVQNGIAYTPLLATPTAGSDNLIGTVAGDDISGLAGRDLLIGLAGDDSLNGGADLDTAGYGGARGNYTVVYNPATGGITVTDGSGVDGIDALVEIERLAFADRNLAFDINGNAGQTYRLYQAAFARQPDVPGLSFWIGQMDLGAALPSVASQFIGSAEFTAKYGANPSNADFVTLLYQNVLNRLPDAGGLAFWVNQLDAATISRPEVLIGFSESTENQVALIGVLQLGIEYLPLG